MDPTVAPDAGLINLILNAVSTGGLVSTLTLGIIAFVRGWVYPAKTVDAERESAKELGATVKELTETLKSIGLGVDKLADAWESRNELEKDKMLEDRLRRAEERR